VSGFAVQTGLFFQRKLLETLRQPVWLITGLTTPVLYLALFAPLLRSLAGGPAFPPGRVLDVFVPGIMVLIAFGAGMGAGWPVIWELDSGVIERLRVTPASRLALLLGTVRHGRDHGAGHVVGDAGLPAGDGVATLRVFADYSN
jgi:ABC-2 type transport system permease protein